MRFHKRYLKTNDSTRFPSNVVVLDTETNPYPYGEIVKANIHRLKVWCAIAWRNDKGKQTRRKEKSGMDKASFWSWLYANVSPYKPTYVFAHNIGFDLTVLGFWKELWQGKLTLTAPPAWRGSDKDAHKADERLGVLCVTDPPTIIESWIAGTRKRIVFLDTLNYWRCSLEKLGEEFGLAKLLMPAFADNETAWLRYCWRDVMILEKAILGLRTFIDSNDAGVFKYTISSQSLASFKHKFMKHKISLHREPEQLKLERAAYRGGEVKIGFIGQVASQYKELVPRPAKDSNNNKAMAIGPVYVYDVQSFYPSIMQGNNYPCELLGSVVSPSLDSLAKLCESNFVVAQTTVNSPINTYPTRIEGLSLMARGEFVTTICGPELKHAICQGDIKSIWRVCYYRQAMIFDDFVSYWYWQRLAAKRDGKRETEMMIKTLLNSLFGKFGQRSERWQDRPDVKSPRPWGMFLADDPTTGESEWFRSICMRTQVNADQGESAESFPAIAAAVTSYGRDRMRQIREICGTDQFLYQDTDSIHCLYDGSERIIKSGLVKEGEIGKLVLKGMYETAEYRGIKNYTLDGNHVISGIKQSAAGSPQDGFTQLEFQKLASVLSAEPHDGVCVREVFVPAGDRLPVGKVDPWGFVSPPWLS